MILGLLTNELEQRRGCQNSDVNRRQTSIAMSWNVEYKAGPNYSAETMKDIFEDKNCFQDFQALCRLKYFNLA